MTQVFLVVEHIVLAEADAALFLHALNSQAAGHAAAMSVQKQILPREVDGKELRALLVAEGAHLNEPPMGYWETVRNTEGEFFVNTADTISIRSNKAPSFM